MEFALYYGRDGSRRKEVCNVGRDNDWNDYLEPEVEGPETHCVFTCPKCGFNEVVPDTAAPLRTWATTVTCPKCKAKMYEDAGF